MAAFVFGEPSNSPLTPPCPVSSPGFEVPNTLGDITMELKDPVAGMILRALANAWENHRKDDKNLLGHPQGWKDCSVYCGKTLSDELDKLNVPPLKDESK